jgi:hypothetical protein
VIRASRTRRRSGPPPARDWVAVVLAVGIATAVNIIVIAVFYDAVVSQESGLSENSTQVITTAFGGIIGVLGGYLGGRAVEQRQSRDEAGTEPVEPDDPTML